MILTEGLRQLGFSQVVPVQPRRLREGYGFHQSLAQEMIDSGVQLIITVDVGITAVETVQWLADRKIDVILTDHHLPGPQLPPAHAIVNPNQGGCTSELGYLSGAGVGLYLLRALKSAFVHELQLSADGLVLKSHLDLYAIATISDMVPIRGDNWLLVKLGLLELSRTQRPAMQILLQKLGLYGLALTAEDVGLKIAPKLNALTRLDGKVRAQDLMWRAEREDQTALVNEALAANENRRDLQQGAIATVEGLITPDAKVVCAYSADFHKGVIGLVAQHVTKTYNLPAFIGSLQNGKIVGSSRAPDATGFHLVEMMAEATALLERFGGHEKAAGFELKEEHWPDFVAKLQEIAARPSLGAAVKVNFIDFLIQTQRELSEFFEWFPRLAPYGKDFASPVVAVPVSLVRWQELKGLHLQLRFGVTGLRGIHFSATDEERQLAREGRGWVIGSLSYNHYQNQSVLQFRAKALVASLAEPTVTTDEVLTNSLKFD